MSELEERLQRIEKSIKELTNNKVPVGAILPFASENLYAPPFNLPVNSESSDFQFRRYRA